MHIHRVIGMKVEDEEKKKQMLIYRYLLDLVDYSDAILEYHPWNYFTTRIYSRTTRNSHCVHTFEMISDREIISGIKFQNIHTKIVWPSFDLIFFLFCIRSKFEDWGLFNIYIHAFKKWEKKKFKLIKKSIKKRVS